MSTTAIEVKFKYIVVEMEGGIIGLNDLELAQAIAEHEPVIDVQAGKFLGNTGAVVSEIESWSTLFPYATVKNPWAARLEEDTELSARSVTDAGDESFPSRHKP